jgi:hypothetical protein
LLDTRRGKRRVHFLHIGKTGGSAIKHALSNVDAKRYEIHLHTHEFRLRNVPAGDGVFFFLRDPATRFVSGFHSRRRQGMPRARYPWNRAERMAFSRFSTPNALAIALTSEDAQVRAEALNAMHGIRHVKSHYWNWFGDESYFRSRFGDVLFVGRQETLDEDFERLKAVLDLPAGIALPKDDVESHRDPTGLDRTLEDVAIENLRSWYREDYRFAALCEELFSPTRGPAPAVRP